MGITKEQELWMKMVRARELRDKADQALVDFKKYTAIDNFLFVTIMLTNNGLTEIPLSLLWSWKFENLIKIFNIRDEILELRKELPSLSPDA